MATKEQKKAFFENNYKYAQKASAATDIPASVILAQWAHESGYGLSPSAQGNNLGGIASFKGSTSNGWHYTSDGNKTLSYASLDDFTKDYITVMKHERYAPVRDGKTEGETLLALTTSKYCGGNNELGGKGYKIESVSGMFDIIKDNKLSKYNSAALPMDTVAYTNDYITEYVKKNQRIDPNHSSTASGKSPFEDAFNSNASDGKGAVGNWIGFDPSNVIVPNMKDGKVPRIVEIDSRQFNNSINNYADMAQVKKITNKLIKNAMPNKHPFGEQLKHDGAPAAIKLILDEVFKDKRTDAAVEAWKRLVAAKIDYIDNFVVERFTEVNSERYQISQSVTDDYKIYFSGKSPVVMNISGHMLNTYNQQWWHDFDYFYDNYLRGSKAVENKIRAFLTIADTIYDVLILKFGVNGDGNFDGVVQYNIDFISLQKIHIGEYKNPEFRDNSVKDLSNNTNASMTQTDLDDNTKKLIDNISKDANGSGARGVSGTNTDKKAVLTWQEEMLNDANYLDNRKIITPDNNANLSTGNSGNTKIPREDLKNTPNANLQQQVRLSRSLVHSGADLDRLQNAANDNRKEKNLLVTKSAAPEGQESFFKGANKPYNRYENAAPLLPADTIKIFDAAAASASASIADSKSLYDNMTKDARAFAADQKVNLTQLNNLINTRPKTGADFAAIANNAMPILTDIAAQTGKFVNDKEGVYINSVRKIDGGVKNTLKLSGQALNAISKQLSDAFNNKGV